MQIARTTATRCCSAKASRPCRDVNLPRALAMTMRWRSGVGPLWVCVTTLTQARLPNAQWTIAFHLRLGILSIRSHAPLDTDMGHSLLCTRAGVGLPAHRTVMGLMAVLREVLESSGASVDAARYMPELYQGKGTEKGIKEAIMDLVVRWPRRHSALCICEPLPRGCRAAG